MGSESEVHFLQLLTGTVVDLIPEDPTITKLKAKFDKFETLTSGTGWAGAFNITSNDHISFKIHLCVHW